MVPWTVFIAVPGALIWVSPSIKKKKNLRRRMVTLTYDHNNESANKGSWGIFRRLINKWVYPVNRSKWAFISQKL